MQEKDSSSDNSSNSTVTSKLRPKYICKQCFKGFNNGHALGGHQNAHRSVKSSSSTQNNVPNKILLGQAQNNNNDHSHRPFLVNDYAITKSTAEGFAGVTLTRQGPPPPGVRVVQSSWFNGNNEDDDPISRRSSITRGVVKVKPNANGSPRYHPYDKGTSKVSNERIITDNQVIKVSKKDGDDDKDYGFPIISSKRNGELELKLKRNEDLDLELRLGFS